MSEPKTGPECLMELVTKQKYDSLLPKVQGYVQYMQGELPGSELKNETNPYPEGSYKHEQWNLGQQIGVMQVQGGDD